MMASSVWRVGAWNPVPAMLDHQIRMAAGESSQQTGRVSVRTCGTGRVKRREEKWPQDHIPIVSLASWTVPRFMLSDGFKITCCPTPDMFSLITRAEAPFVRSPKIYSILSRPQDGGKMDFSSSEFVHTDGRVHPTNERIASLSTLAVLSAFISYCAPANASDDVNLNAAYGDLGALLESGVQILYLGALLILLGVGSFLVVRQVLIKRELETAAKDLQDRVRGGEASSLEYFELGAVMLRKKFHQPARKYLNEAIKRWDGSEQDLAQVYNALGFSYFSDGNVENAISQYEKAVKLQPMYVTAWNNLADAYETKKDYSKALEAYEEALQFDPGNKVASSRRGPLKERVKRLQGIS